MGGLVAAYVAGQHFLLDIGTLCVLGYYRYIPAVRVCNGPLVGRTDDRYRREAVAD